MFFDCKKLLPKENHSKYISLNAERVNFEVSSNEIQASLSKKGRKQAALEHLIIVIRRSSE